MIKGITLKNPKIFFSLKWTWRKVIDKIIKASQNIVEKKLYGCRKLIDGLTEEGITIRMIIDESKKLITAFPFVNKGF